MRTIYLLLFVLGIAVAHDNIIPPKDWKHAVGNENNFDVWAVGINQDSLWHVDLKTGEVKVVGSLGVDIQTAGLSFGKKGILYMLYSSRKELVLSTVNISTGKSTKVKSFGRVFDSTIGFEISKDGNSYYWSNRSKLYELDINQGVVNEVMDLKQGTWCLANAPGGNLYGIGLHSRDLILIDPKNKTERVVKSLNHDKFIPALALTPGGRMYCDDFTGEVFSIQNDYTSLGKIQDSCHGFAISNNPKN